MKIILTLFFCVISLASAQKDTNTSFHAHLGLGYGSSGIGAVLGANFCYNNRFFEVRRAFLLEVQDNGQVADQIGDVAFMYGIYRFGKSRASQANAAVGVGYVSGVNYSPNGYDGSYISTYGLAFQTSYIIALPYAGLSASLHGNFNLSQSFGLFVASLHLGKMY